jgi:hypothetical protein
VRDYAVYYLSELAGSWARTAVDPLETVDINGRDMLMRSTVQYRDLDGGKPSYDCLLVTVRTRYRLNSDDDITLQTILSP